MWGERYFTPLLQFYIFSALNFVSDFFLLRCLNFYCFSFLISSQFRCDKKYFSIKLEMLRLAESREKIFEEKIYDDKFSIFLRRLNGKYIKREKETFSVYVTRCTFRRNLNVDCNAFIACNFHAEFPIPISSHGQCKHKQRKRREREMTNDSMHIRIIWCNVALLASLIPVLLIYFRAFSISADT